MLSRIEQQIPDLSPAEQRVGRWLLLHPKQAANATLAEVSRRCGTSEPTVIRFCRHIGLSGFRELALRITEALSQPVSYVHRAVSAGDDASDAVTKVMDTSIQSLIELRAQLSSMPVDSAVAAMHGARQLAFVGLGASGNVASDACQKFFRLGVPCSTLTNTPKILQFAAIADSGDVLVMTSHKGRWKALSRAAHLARRGGATVIGITDPSSELANEVEILFPCNAVEDTSVYTPMSSRLAQLALLDALHVALALSQGEVAIDMLRRSKAALQEEHSLN
jgi:RpiR family carbohydrate utilization transcriptional regulator